MSQENKNNQDDFAANLFQQITNISKASAYDILLEQHKKLEERNKVLEDALTRARNWFHVHGKKDGKIYADGVKPSCIPYIEIALNKKINTHDS